MRETFSANVGTWRALGGDRDRVFHIWAYADYAERTALRPHINANPDWQAYVAAITPMILSMESMLLTPLPFRQQA